MANLELQGPGSSLLVVDNFDVPGGVNGLGGYPWGGGSNNASCAFSGTSVPSCALGQGIRIAGVTYAADGSAPDLGAFASSQPPWRAGARRPDDSSICGKVADIDAALPPRAPNPWPDGGLGYTASDAGSEAASDAHHPGSEPFLDSASGESPELAGEGRGELRVPRRTPGRGWLGSLGGSRLERPRVRGDGASHATPT